MTKAERRFAAAVPALRSAMLPSKNWPPGWFEDTAMGGTVLPSVAGTIPWWKRVWNRLAALRTHRNCL